MSQEAKHSLQSFITQIDGAAQPQRKAIETRRLQIVENAQSKIAAYQEGVKEVQPEAERVLNKTIYPWWYEFKGSELYQQTVDALKERTISFKLLLNEPISYFWPDLTIKELRDRKPFAYEAKKNVGEDVARYAQPNQYDDWTGNFYFSGIGDEFHRFSFEPWNEARGSWTFSVAVQQLHLSLDPRRESVDLFAKVNPSVYIGFGSQIESGQVWRVLEQSVRRALRDR